MNQRLAVIPLILCASALARAGQDLPADTANLGIKELAFEVPEVSTVRSSTPGSMLAYGQEVGSDIFVIDAQNSKPRKLISGGARPAWSPDGSQIAYCTWQGVGYGQIEVANADGTGGRLITNMKGGACFPDWSPDGTKIVFTELRVGNSEKNLYGANSSEIFVVDKNGGDPVPITPGYAARWSPGGTMLILLRGPEKKGSNGSVWLATADGKESKNLIASDRRIASATWLPNGKGIAVSTIIGARYSIFRIYLDGAQPQGNQPQKIAGDDKANWTEPIVSPDGKHLMVVNDCSGGYWDTSSEKPCRGHSIELLDLDTNKDVPLATGDYYSVVWDRK